MPVPDPQKKQMRIRNPEKKGRNRIRKPVVRIRVSGFGSVSKCHGSRNTAWQIRILIQKYSSVPVPYGTSYVTFTWRVLRKSRGFTQICVFNCQLTKCALGDRSLKVRIDRSFELRGEIGLIRSVMANWRLGNFFYLILNGLHHKISKISIDAAL